MIVPILAQTLTELEHLSGYYTAKIIHLYSPVYNSVILSRPTYNFIYYTAHHKIIIYYSQILKIQDDRKTQGH